MRILIITNRYPSSPDDPASPFVPHFVDALQRLGVGVDVLTPQYAPQQVSEPEFVHRFPTDAETPIGSWNWTDPGSVMRLMRFLRRGQIAGEMLCKEQQFDHILALWALPSGHFAAKLSRRFDIPYSVWCLGSDIYVWGRRPYFGGAITHVLQGATCVFGDGEDLCRKAHEQFKIASTYLPSYRPMPTSGDPKTPTANDHPRFLYLGRIHPDKGVYELLDAIENVRAALPNATFRFVGDGPASVELLDRIGLRQLSRSVTFDGTLDQQGVVAAYRECDSVVIPTKSDSLPLVFTEAVHMGRPVIGTDAGDLGRFIRRYRVGMVTASLDRRDLSATMIAMAQAPIFDLEGRSELLRLMDPMNAAKMFCYSISTGMQVDFPGFSWHTEERSPIADSM